MLQALSLCFSYDAGTAVLNGVDLDLRQGEIVALLGASGCGKSTLLRVVSGLEAAESGCVNWRDTPNFSFVFQDAALMPWATVDDNVALPLTIAKRIDDTAVKKALMDVGLGELGDRYPSQLSGGQKMRVSIARALVSQPKLLFLDEPFGALDEILRFQMNELLLKVKAQHSLACLFVTHSVYEAAYLADRVLIMHDGKIKHEVIPALNRSQTSASQRASGAFLNAVKNIADCLAGQG